MRFDLLLLCSVAALGVAQADPPSDSMVRFGVEQAPARQAGAVRLATYNVENLFDLEDDPQLSGQHDDASQIKPHEELEAVAKAIRAMDADIVALQEIESLEALLWFRDTYLDGAGYDHVVSLDAGYYRGVENSVLSRFPLKDARVWPGLDLGEVHPEKWGDRPNRYAGEPMLFRRSPLMVRVEVPGAESQTYELTLFVVHHKSGRNDSYWREAEARKVIELCDEQRKSHPHANIIVLGDFNATTSADSVKTYLESGFTNITGGETGAKWMSHESGRRIDLILASESMRAEIIDGSSFVFGTPARPEGVDWRSVPTFPGYASDHYPVVVDILPHEKLP